MIHAPFQHSEIVATQASAVWRPDGPPLIVITEYRADGCVTWKEGEL